MAAKKASDAARPAPAVALGLRHTHPAATPRQHVGQQHQQRDHAHALGDDAQAGRKTAQPPGAPVRATQQVDQQAPVGQRDQCHHQRIDLGALDLVGKLEGQQHHGGGKQTDAGVPQAPADVPGQRQRRQAGQQRGQQERDAPVAGDQVEHRLQPHQHRRLVGIQLAAAVREQPVARGDHLPATSVKRGSSDGQGSRRPMPAPSTPAPPASAARSGAGPGRWRRHGVHGVPHARCTAAFRAHSAVCSRPCGRATGTAGCGNR
jgi:hypothetical protein